MSSKVIDEMRKLVRVMRENELFATKTGSHFSLRPYAQVIEQWAKDFESAGTELAKDPDSGLPLGSIVRNAKGKYGVIGYKKVIDLTDEQAKELLKVADSLGTPRVTK